MDLPLIPLAERIRPKSFDDFIGQEHLIGENGPIKKAVKNGAIPSMILVGTSWSG
jgi:putative ATPase